MGNNVTMGRRTITIIPDLTDINAMTRAAACAVTWTAHGLATGDRVSFQGITQTDWTALNGNSYVITKTSANAFTIPVNTSAYTGAYDGSTDPGLIGSDFDVTMVLTGTLQLNSVAGVFVAGETVTQATSGATGVVLRWGDPVGVLRLVNVVGTFDNSHTVTGGTSSATGVPDSVQPAFPNGIRLCGGQFTPSQAQDKLIIRERSAVGPIIFDMTATDGKYHDLKVGGRSLKRRVYMSWKDCVFATPASVIIVLEYD